MKEQLEFELSQVQQQALKRALLLLDGIKCKYAVVDPLGNKHGSLEIKEPTKRTTNTEFVFGERSKYARQFLKDMPIGGVVEVPKGPYELHMVQSIGTSVSQKMWGIGSVTTTVNRDKNCVEFLRLQ
jgi:hypothetical protein